MRRLIPRLARLVPLAMLAAIGLTLFLGRQPVGSPLAVVAKDTGIGVRGGRLHLRDGAHFAVALDPAWARPIEIELSIKPEWVGQVFFELTTDDGAASLFLTAESFDREFRESRTFRIALDDRAFALRDWGGDTIREVPAPGGAPRSVTLRLVSTGIVATRVEVRSAGNTVFQTNFGPALSDTGVVFALFLAVLFVLYGMSRIDAALLSRAPFLDQQAVRDTFASGLAPFVTGLGFFDSASRPAGIAFLLLATLPWRLALASGRGAVPLVVWAIPVAASAASLGVVFSNFSMNNWPPPALRLSPLPAVIAASVVLLFAALAGAFWRHGAALPGRVAWRNAALPFLVAAMTGAALLVPAIPIETRLHIAGVGWPSAVVAALVLVRRHAGARGAGAMIALAGLAFLVMAEAAVRHADYADTWTAHGVGEGFVTDETLFWAPRNLFITPNEISAPKSSIVNRVQFRSGATTDEIPPDTFRVVITGGSNVWGDGIENLEDTWGEKLESRLAERTGRPVEVVNAGVKGYNLFQLLVLHTMYLRDLRGDVLVLYLNYNDIMAAKERGPFTLRELWEARRGGRWDEIESYMRKTGLAPRTSWLGRVQDALHESRLYNGATRAIIAWRGKRVARVAEAAIRTINPVEDYVKNLEEMVALARERGMKVIFAPEFDSNVARFGTDAGFGSGENGARPETGPGFLEFRRAMEQTANRLGVPFCPTHASMAASRPDLDALVFPWDPVHLSPTGTTRLAEIMDECLVEKGMLGD